MDTSRRNNVPPCKDDDDIWYWGHSIFVPHIPNTRAYPYVSRIMGPDPKYRFARKFLQYQWPPKTPKGRRFDVELPGDGVYEVGIKRWNADKTLLLERQVYWLLLLDGNEYTIPKWQVLPLVEALRNGTLGARFFVSFMSSLLFATRCGRPFRFPNIGYHSF